MGFAKGPVLCPSSRCAEGAQLLGVVQKDGRVAFTPDEIWVDTTFVQIAHLGRKPEARFRFASPCQRGRCEQWTGERCGVVDAVVDALSEAEVPHGLSLPRCSIRSRCRWFAQSGAEGCRVCPFVITDIDSSGQEPGG